MAILNMDRRTIQLGFSNFNKFQCEWSQFLKLNLNIYFMAILRTAAVSFQTQQFIVHKMRIPPPSWWFAERTPAAWQTQYTVVFIGGSRWREGLCVAPQAAGDHHDSDHGGGGGGQLNIFIFAHAWAWSSDLFMIPGMPTGLTRRSLSEKDDLLS